MNAHTNVSEEAWLAARKELLEREKAFTRERDALSAARRAMPWHQIDKTYLFDTEDGPKQLGDLFGDRKQLAVYHFMYGPDWEAGCKSCSFWADGYNGTVEHLRHRNVQLVATSRAPLDTLLAFRERMGWSFPWVSSGTSGFSEDFGVSFAPGDPQPGDIYNYQPKQFPAEELPGFSAFIKDDDGTIYHTYSTYSRGLDIFNATYNMLDMMPLGRDEDALDYPMAWVRLRDEY